MFLANDGSDIDDDISPRNKEQVNKNNFTDFCVKNIENADLGRKEIQIAEQGMEINFNYSILINK